jgi:hypothetical protein
VIPVERDGGPVYVHSMPISREVFERYFMTIAKTFGRIMVEGLAHTSPRIAMLMLRKTAQDDGNWSGAGGVELGLVSEIRRLTNVLLPSDNGWEMLSWHDAVREKRLDDEEVAEVENLLAFFILSAAMRRRKEHEEMMEAMAEAFNLQTTSLDCTEFASSLPTLTATGSTGATSTDGLGNPVSLIPS